MLRQLIEKGFNPIWQLNGMNLVSFKNYRVYCYEDDTYMYVYETTKNSEKLKSSLYAGRDLNEMLKSIQC